MSAKGDFSNYWFSSGMPTFLINTINKNEDFDFDEIVVDELALNNFNIDHIDSVTLMFQAGYLTIKTGENGVYTLVYPNMEVKKSLLTSMLSSKTENITNQPMIMNIGSYFEKYELEKIQDSIDAMFSRIPHQIFMEKSEFYYQSILVVAFQLLGCYTHTEVSVAKGRIDAVVYCEKYIYVLEFKVNQSASIAMQQIKDRAYSKGFDKHEKQIVCIGINFKEKQIQEMLVEIV